MTPARGMAVPHRALVYMAAALAAGLAGGTCCAQQPRPDSAAPTVIPFDFTSSFDDGRMGRKIGESIWRELQRRGRFVIPDSMLDVRDWSASHHNLVPRHDTPLEDMRRYVCEDLGGDIGIWGSVERVPGTSLDAYELWIVIVDFTGQPPRTVERNRYRTSSVSEIPHSCLQTALDKLYGPAADRAATPDPRIEQRWRDGPNLVQGDFERGRPGPAGWDPLHAHVARIAEDPSSAATNHVLRFQIPEDVAGSTGVLYYSDYFPVEEGATYRFQCRWRSSGSAVKVFIKAYDEFAGVFGDATQRREVYRSQQNLQGAPDIWHVHSEDFTPRHTQFQPRWARVMLYAYWPAGVVDWDDVVVKQIQPASAGTSAKVRRPSGATKVRSDEIEKRRSKRK